MKTCEIIPIDKGKKWEQSLQKCGAYDTYDLPSFHLVEKQMGNGEPFLFFLGDGDNYAALPFLLRPVSCQEGLESQKANDAISLYGYPGIVTNVQYVDQSKLFFQELFQENLIKYLNQLQCVSLFVRFNPLLGNSWLVNGLGQVFQLSKTIVIDLSISEEDQLKNMTKGHRYDIRTACKNGVFVKEDLNFEHLDDFIRIYNETMDRVGASKNYFFPRQYYLSLRELLGNSIKLFIARKENLIVSAALFLVTGDIIQYHLSGTAKKFIDCQGAKLIIDFVRQWGKKNSYKWLHLGGGVGSTEDPLFRFKAGFSKRRLPFEVAKLIVDQSAYTELVAAKEAWELTNGYKSLSDDFFPQYRRPVSTCH